MEKQMVLKKTTKKQGVLLSMHYTLPKSKLQNKGSPTLK